MAEYEEPEDYEPECTCIQVDADLFDARWCQAHGPHSREMRDQLRQEAEDERQHWRAFSKPSIGLDPAIDPGITDDDCPF